jgi:hypothetical protein
MAALMFAMVPVKVIVGLLAPLPVTKVRPVVWARVNLPFVTLNVTCSALPPASTSLTKIGLPLVEENTNGESSLVLCATGTVFTGALSMEVTPICRVAGALVRFPSLVTKVTVRVAVFGF